MVTPAPDHIPARGDPAWDLANFGIHVPEIENPERFFPDPYLIKDPQTRWLDDGWGEFYRDDKDEWERLHPIGMHIIDGLRKKLTFDELSHHVPLFPELNLTKPKKIAKVVRKYTWKLHVMGYARFDIEEAPERFHGRYRVTKELGRGGLGIAYLCQDEKASDRSVVVKQPWGIKARIKSGQEAIAVEIHLMGKLDHPSIPRLHDSFADRGLLHLVRDFVDGQHLSRYVPAATKDRDLRMALFSQVVESLGTIHDAGFLFFDPSPDNFFVVDDERVISTDLGGCRPHIEGYVAMKGPRGTGGYVAKELRRIPRGPWFATKAADVYSVGCLYYCMTFGRRPKRLWLHDEIVASMKEAGCEDRDIEIVSRCTHDDMKARPQDMWALKELIHRN